MKLAFPAMNVGILLKKLLCKLFLVSYPFERVGLDVLGPLPISHDGNKFIVIFTDYLTKNIEAFPTADQTTETIARLLVTEVIARHGIMAQLLTDRGSNFTSLLFKSLCEKLGVKKIFTTAYHPQTDGQVERFNATLCKMLSHYVDDDQRNWDKQLILLLYAYRTAVHSSTRETTFTLLLEGIR